MDCLERESRSQRSDSNKRRKSRFEDRGRRGSQDEEAGREEEHPKGAGDNDEFMRQMREATDRARRIAEQLNVQMATGSSGRMSDEQRRQYAEQRELKHVYDEMMEKRREIESVAAKFNNDYGSDEAHCIQGGTWEHALRKAEMEATKGGLLFNFSCFFIE